MDFRKTSEEDLIVIIVEYDVISHKERDVTTPIRVNRLIFL